jgi:hypothetical protein
MNAEQTGTTGAIASGDPDAAAVHRVAEVLVALGRLDINVVVLPPPDGGYVDALHRARDAAIVAGRRTLLDSAARNARDVAFRAFSRSGFSGTWAATDMGASVVRAGDRAAVAAAFEGAATAAVAEDVIDSETLDILREPAEALRLTTGLPAPGALSNFGSGRTTSAGGASPDAVQVGLGIAVGIVGVVVAIASGVLPLGLLVIAGGLALVGLIGRRWTAR